MTLCVGKFQELLGDELERLESQNSFEKHLLCLLAWEDEFSSVLEYRVDIWEVR